MEVKEKNELSPLQKEFRDFFQKMLDKFGVKTPAELSKEQKENFFNAISLYWENGKGPAVNPDKTFIPGAKENPKSESLLKDILEKFYKKDK